MRKTWMAFQDQSIRRYLFHTEFFFFFNLQVVWYQGTVCKPWPPFFQKVVIKVSPRNTRSQSNTTIIWACHCCSKLLVLTLFCCWLDSSIMFPSVWFHCFDGSDFDCTQGLFYTPANKVWGGGYTVGGRSYPESSCSSIHFSV